MTNLPHDNSDDPTEEDEESQGPKDLRMELEEDLKSKFAANLSRSGALPKVACDSLVALLDSSSPIYSDVLAALNLEDPSQSEKPNE